jgi:hypothetical protein
MEHENLESTEERKKLFKLIHWFFRKAAEAELGYSLGELKLSGDIDSVKKRTELYAIANRVKEAWKKLMDVDSLRELDNEALQEMLKSLQNKITTVNKITK